MRVALSIVLLFLTIALILCVFYATRSKKPIAKYVAILLAVLTTPVAGNFLVITTDNKVIANIGYNLNFIGMDAFVIALLFFIYAYCEMGKPKKGLQAFVIAVGALDVLQYVLNPFLKFTYTTETIMVDGSEFHRIIPGIGQNLHMDYCLGVFVGSFIILIVVTAKASKVYVEKYLIILLSMVAAVVIRSYSVISRQPLDTSMLGFGIFGILVFYFSLHYRSMRVLDRILASMASDMPEALFFFDGSGKCIWMNEPGKKLIGYSKGKYDEVKTNLKFLFDDIDFENTGWEKRVTIGHGDDVQFVDLTMSQAEDDKGRPTGSYLSVRDNTKLELEHEQEIYNSTHDDVTNLFTKEYFYERVAKRLSIDEETDYMAGYFEISNFKVINDVFGTEFGNYAVKNIADILRKTSSKKTLYGRLTFDSFGILIDKSKFDEDKLEEMLENFTVKDDNLEHRLIVRFGIYDITKEDETDVPLFFDSARLATTMISDNYQRRIVYYDDELRDAIIHDQLISNQLSEAIAKKQIKPYLQPIVDQQGLLVGAEALIRWEHPDEGLMCPSMFIPVFERNGLIAVVDKYMWRCACELLAEWKKKGIGSFISINISPRDFYRLDVVAELKALVEEFGVEPVKLRVEITETAMTTDIAAMQKLISDLRGLGFIVEMDDFGSGYSSLNLLKDINLDLIKIDMNFLQDSEHNAKAGLIIKNIINMSEDIGIATLTEGVETAKQFENLYSMGCRLFQGYYFSKPVPVETFESKWFV